MRGFAAQLGEMREKAVAKAREELTSRLLLHFEELAEVSWGALPTDDRKGAFTLNKIVGGGPDGEDCCISSGESAGLKGGIQGLRSSVEVKREGGPSRFAGDGTAGTARKDNHPHFPRMTWELQAECDAIARDLLGITGGWPALCAGVVSSGLLVSPP
ncbi:unnamed protein product [Phytomonas sp. Hart1]|nr:unnamed protein product [Phytomonas sp. Hart1]|eukprot:CCW72309.1 unnamed protein product [Phytomonas sp. isolate Hart1]